MTTPDTWTPDPMLVDAARAGRIHATQLPGPDRCYLVAALTEKGMSAAQIADQLHCSLRTIKTIRAEPITAAVRRQLAAETAAAAATQAAEQSAEDCRRAATAAETETSRLRNQASDLIEQLRRTRAALDHERAQRFRRADVHIHVYRRRPTPTQIAQDTPSLLDLLNTEQDQ